jgi:hypothetical protein
MSFMEVIMLVSMVPLSLEKLLIPNHFLTEQVLMELLDQDQMDSLSKM